MEEAHKVATTPSPPANSTTGTPALQLNMHMLSRSNQTSSEQEQTAEPVKPRGPSAMRSGSDLRGGKDNILSYLIFKILSYLILICKGVVEEPGIELRSGREVVAWEAG